MQRQGVEILDQFAEGFRMWAVRLIVTAANERWLRIAVGEVTGYASSVIGCDAEAGLERLLPAAQSPDGRPAAAVLFFAFNAKALAKAVPNRVGQCLLTCPTTAVYDGLPSLMPSDDSDRLPLGDQLRYFGDGFQKSKVLPPASQQPAETARTLGEPGSREKPGGLGKKSGGSGGAESSGGRVWRLPVMDGEFVVQASVGAAKAVGGGNFLICGKTQRQALDAAAAAVDAIARLPDVITPFPGGVVRSGSKVGSRYKALFASTNDAWCPTLTSRTASQVPPGVQAVYEIVINGLSQQAVDQAIAHGIDAACSQPGLTAIGAGNYGGKLGKFHFHLRPLLEQYDRKARA